MDEQYRWMNKNILENFGDQEFGSDRMKRRERGEVEENCLGVLKLRLTNHDAENFPDSKLL